ncbi:hypothetical protein EOD41_00550 [Mucilaginibacter limnophilus]|uniref:O-antigen ligase domain-containing protein n=1 Tax=Mucilaginibacter limnophilus TaxID=1932778 RepID=A0A437MXV7_9SPHI|nr:hypothetical protein [Mucilaginibacter limnophilus]RVU02463.1 hypothetical protein EOD41_00550 [Mucilaginibacter limnophilus]
MITAIAHQAPQNNVSLFVGRYINIMMLFFPITTFLLVPSIPGTTIITMLAAMLFVFVLFLPAGQNKMRFFNELLLFTAVILILSFCSQFINLVNGLKLDSDLVLINRKDYTRTFYRTSHITQTLSLIVGFVIYAYVKYFSNPSILKYVYWGLRLLCFYALYELAFYMLTGSSGDFMVNRTFGYEEKSASLFQTVNIAGINLMRIKGYTGEPSMFVFTVFPFWVLSFSLKRSFDNMLMLTCLVLTFSTTAYLCIILFLTYWIIYNRHFITLYYLCVAVVGMCFVLQLDQFQHLLDSLYNFVFAGKLEGESVSSRDRGNHFTGHLIYWANLNWLSQLFGIGFGYIRSTDFFSTLLVNNGLIGFILFSWFVLRNLLLNINGRIIEICYKLGLVLLYLIMMATVPEFAYPSFWIYIALGFVLSRAAQQAKTLTEDAITSDKARLLKIHE